MFSPGSLVAKMAHSDAFSGHMPDVDNDVDLNNNKVVDKAC